MRLQELPQYLEIDLQEALENRFMESEKLYIRFLRKLPASQDFQAMTASAAAADWQETLRKAHNLKGVCANLGLTGLSKSFAGIVSLLRSENFTGTQVREKIAALAPVWEQTLAYINALEE